MSGQFKDKGTERVTLKETLLLRKELIGKLIYTSKKFRKDLKDSFGNYNFLLPNNIKEKVDNGDVDIFFYGSKEENQSVMRQLKRISIESNLNGGILSILYHSEIINKKVQIDVHLIERTKMNLDNYFFYFKVPYFFFILSYVLKTFKGIDKKFKISTSGLFYLNGHENILIDKNLQRFIRISLGLTIKDMNDFDSYEKIGKFFSNLGVSKEILLKGNKDKTLKNDKFQRIVDYINGDGDIRELYEKIINSYDFIELKIKDYERKKEKERIIKEEIENKTKKLFGVENFGELDLERKKLIGSFKKNVDEFLILKEIKEAFPGKGIYLCGGGVRDIFIGTKIKDYDLSGQVSPEEFQKVFGGEITEEYGTVFTRYKGIDIEYTPFRKESLFDGRHAEKIIFSQDIKEDASRRDFTINSLYLDLNNFEIVDFFGGIEDLKNKEIRTVGDPDQRFEEDYLRILRGIRLGTKISGSIEKETYNSMLKNCHKIIEKVDLRRIINEVFLGIRLQNKKYVILLGELYKKIGLIEKNILDIYSEFMPHDIYGFLFEIHKKLFKDFNDFSGKIEGVNRGLSLKIKKRANKILSSSEKDLNKLEGEELIKFLILFLLEFDSRTIFDKKSGDSKKEIKMIFLFLFGKGEKYEISKRLVEDERIKRNKIEVIKELGFKNDKEFINYFKKEVNGDLNYLFRDFLVDNYFDFLKEKRII